MKVLVTGATGSIGEEIVKEYAKNSYFVYIHYNKNIEKRHFIMIKYAKTAHINP